MSNDEPKVVGVGGVFFKTENTEETTIISIACCWV